MSTDTIAWRPLAPADLPSVEAIAADVHPDFFEEPAVFAERQRLYPAGTHLLEVEGAPAGYVLSHPWRLGSLPALNALLGALPHDADTYYLHDLALLPRARGTGAAGRIVADLVAHARQAGFAAMSLVAVNCSRRFWEKHGFAVRDVSALAGKLMSYEDGAHYMVRALA
ncbi:GCN5 family acetyltransferase [Devosia geojensis]|uniref:GCN5 family acetyltransferase n=1 Tax=Devosia geojensis TaxID=443610 RepID=A0A0F5FP96_9HYPH|nr:GNAT family N-acetyltransferase [Devosia geojensis]KKB10661.1 GCN5 family acetyltransferase [Devosia geojensis]